MIFRSSAAFLIGSSLAEEHIGLAKGSICPYPRKSCQATALRPPSQHARDKRMDSDSAFHSFAGIHTRSCATARHANRIEVFLDAGKSMMPHESGRIEYCGVDVGNEGDWKRPRETNLIRTVRGSCFHHIARRQFRIRACPASYRSNASDRESEITLQPQNNSDLPLDKPVRHYYPAFRIVGSLAWQIDVALPAE